MTAPPPGPGAAGTSTYHVVLLAEQPLSQQDARQVRSLHEAVEDPVHYHLLLPVDDAAGRVESAMGVLGTGDAFIASPAVVAPEEVEGMHRELLAQDFISLDVMDGTAARVIELAKGAGVALTQAGSSFPYGRDPHDRNIRLAPTFPEPAEVEQATRVVATCARLSCAGCRRESRSCPALHR